ncbi:MAG: SPOR domain-containing protein, partial [Phycisphaerales bacterium]|nr:SPOR domain-containing protein [Phycisphaerales bacterium]
ELAATARSGASSVRTTDYLATTPSVAPMPNGAYYGSAEESMQVNDFNPTASSATDYGPSTSYAAANPVPVTYGSVPPVSAGRFTLQAGAFRELDRAEVAARQAETIAAAHGLGRVTIVPRRDVRGRTLYLVQFGSFATRADASRRRDRIGNLEIIVTQTAG